MVKFILNEGLVEEDDVKSLLSDICNHCINKGILITNTDFTQKAKEIADRKNIELINKIILNELIERYFTSDLKPVNRENLIRVNYFIKFTEFDLEKYKFLLQMVEKDKKNYDAYVELFDFLYSYIVNKNYKIMYSGLIYECISLTEKILKKFAKKTKSGSVINQKFSTVQGVLYMLLGQVDMSFEVLHNLKYITFNVNNFAENLVNHYFFFKPEHFTKNNLVIFVADEYFDYVFDEVCLIYKANLLTLLVQLSDSNCSNWLYQQFVTYYKNVQMKVSKEDIFSYRGDRLIDIAAKNYNIALQQIEKVMNKDEQKLYLPSKVASKYSYPRLHYSLDNFINLDDIKPYWSDIDFEAQKHKIGLIIGLNN